MRGTQMEMLYNFVKLILGDIFSLSQQAYAMSTPVNLTLYREKWGL